MFFHFVIRPNVWTFADICKINCITQLHIWSLNFYCTESFSVDIVRDWKRIVEHEMRIQTEKMPNNLLDGQHEMQFKWLPIYKVSVLKWGRKRMALYDNVIDHLVWCADVEHHSINHVQLSQEKKNHQTFCVCSMPQVDIYVFSTVKLWFITIDYWIVIANELSCFSFCDTMQTKFNSITTIDAFFEFTSFSLYIHKFRQ